MYSGAMPTATVSRNGTGLAGSLTYSSKPSSPASSGGSLGRTVDTYALSARVADGGIEAGLRALVTEAERVRRHGFAAAELERARKTMLAAYERGFLERDKTESGSYAREYVANFIDAEPSPGIETEYRLVTPDGADPARGAVSVESPLGRALLGKSAGEEVTVERPRGAARYTIVSVYF